MEPIGTIEILKVRVYPLDPEMGHEPLATTVVVNPGEYTLYRDGMSYFWMMTGRINTRGFHRLGDGIFSMNESDRPDGPEVTFPSKTFGPDEWAAFTAEPTCTEGHNEQRLRIRLTEIASRSGR